MKKNILIISYTTLHHQPRFLRQIEALNNEYFIETIGYSNANRSGIVHHNISGNACKNIFEKIRKALRIVFHFYDKELNKLLSIDFLLNEKFASPDLIIAHDWKGLYVACCLREKNNWNSKIYFDAHEYFPKYRKSLFWKLFENPLIDYTFKKFKNSFDIISTVCPTLASMYDNYFNLPKDTVKVVTNSPDYEPELKPVPVGEKIRMIHHGGAMKERQLEKMIDMMKYLPKDEYELSFMLVKSDSSYYEKVVKRATKYKNIHFLEPISFSQIPSFTNQFDIGLYILNNDIINHRYALPNKFFEFVQARLAIAVGDSPEMRNYINKYKLGISAKSNNPKDLANEILKLSKEDIMQFKQNSDKYAKELSAEKNIDILKNIAKQLTK